MTGWGAEQLDREELRSLGTRLRRGWAASVRQANRSLDAGQMRGYLAVAAEVCGLWGEAVDELIARRETRVQGVTARAPEAGS